MSTKTDHIEEYDVASWIKDLNHIRENTRGKEWNDAMVSLLADMQKAVKKHATYC